MTVGRTLAVLALGLAGSLFAFVPAASTKTSAAAVDGRLGVSSLVFEDLTVAVISITSADPIARLELFVPAGYAVDLGKPAGTRIGFVSSTLFDAPRTTSPIVADGEIVVDDPARYATDQGAQACAPGTHAAVWQTTLSVLGQAFALPIFVDAAPAGSPGGAAFVLRVCPGWSSPAQPSGVVTSQLSLFLEQVFTLPTAPGRYTWSALTTPTLLASTAPDPSQAFELRAIVLQPHTLTLRARHDPKSKTVVLSGRLTGAGEPEPGASISFAAFTDASSDQTFFGPVTTNASGEFSIRRRIGRSTQFQASVDATERPCTTPSSAPAGCPAEVVTPPSGVSAVVRVRTARDPRLVVRARDLARARRIGMRLGDFPPGWEVFETLPIFACPSFKPRLADLTATGEHETPAFVGESAVASSRTAIYLTEAQARIAFRREASLALARCLANDARRDGAKVLQLGAISFPPLGSETRAFRAVLSEGEDVTTIDLVSFRQGRAVVHLGFASAVQPFVGERELAEKVAARARSG